MCLSVVSLSVIVMALGNSARGTRLSPLNEPGRERRFGGQNNGIWGLWGLGRSLSAGLVRSWNSCGHWNSWKQLQSVNETDVIWCGLGFVADLFGVTETPRNDKVNIKIFKFKKYTQHLMFKVKACSRAKLQVEVHFGESPPCSHAGCPASVAPEVPLRVHQVPDLWNLVVSSVNHRVHIF
jgi:hypothetical protein